MANPESVREWYERTTRTKIRLVTTAVVVSALAALILWVWLPADTILKLQVFNGAVTIPIGALIWIAAFMLIWMIPIREVSFRTLEATNEMQQSVIDFFEGKAQKLIEDEIRPTLEIWRNLGKRLEEQLDKKTLDELKESIRSIAEFAEPKGAPPDLDRGLRSPLKALSKDKENGNDT